MTKRRKSKSKQQVLKSQEIKNQNKQVNAPTSNQSKDEKGKNEETKKSMLFAIGKYLLVTAISFGLGLLSHIIIEYYFPNWLNRPEIIIEEDNISGVDLSALLEDQIDTTPDLFTRYNAVVDGDNSADVDNAEYGFICGDAQNPGYGDVVLRLFNHGKAQAIIKRFEIELMDYKPIENVEYHIQEASKIRNPKEDIVLYGSIDPLISNTKTLKTQNAGMDDELDTIDEVIDTSISIDENKAFYLRTAFLKYGLYKLNIKVYFTYDGNKAFSISSKPVCILYDSPDSLYTHLNGEE